MKDANSVITQATNGIADKMAIDREISLTRMYEMLGDQCTYPKAKRLIRAIARHNQNGARLIKADLDAMFADILEESPEVSLTDLHREAFEAIDAVLDGKPAADQLKELRELVAIAQMKIEGIERLQSRERDLRAV